MENTNKTVIGHENMVELSYACHHASYQRTCPGNVGCPKLCLLQWEKRGPHDVMNIIHKHQVACLKMAIFQLQKQNDMLVGELNYRTVGKNKEDASSHETSHSNIHSIAGSEPKLIAIWNALKELKYAVKEVMTLNKEKNVKEFASPEVSKSPEIFDLKRKVKQLQKEVDHQKLLRQQMETEIQKLMVTKVQLSARFHKQLQLQKKEFLATMQALLLKAITKHVVSDANQGKQREKQLELYISAMHEKFRDVLLSVQARNTKSHHNDRQIIGELERRLTISETIL